MVQDHLTTNALEISGRVVDCATDSLLLCPVFYLTDTAMLSDTRCNDSNIEGRPSYTLMCMGKGRSLHIM